MKISFYNVCNETSYITNVSLISRYHLCHKVEIQETVTYGTLKSYIFQRQKYQTKISKRRAALPARRDVSSSTRSTTGLAGEAWVFLFLKPWFLCFSSCFWVETALSLSFSLSLSPPAVIDPSREFPGHELKGRQ